MRRFFFYFFGFVVIVILALLVWYFFFQKNTITEGGFSIPKNPFGDVGNVTKPDQNGQIGEGENISLNQPKTNPNKPVILEKIWNKPVAGYTFINLPIIVISTSTDSKGKEITIQTRATTTSLFFVEKESGNVYKKDLDTNTLFRITNTTVPGVYDAYFIDNASFVAMRTYDRKTKRIQTLVGTLPKTASPESPQALEEVFFLPEAISTVSPSPDSKLLYYAITTSNGSSVYAWSKEKGAALISNIPLKEILLSTSRNGVFATTKSSAYVPGTIFSLPAFSPTYGGKTGLTTNINPKGDMLLNSMWSNSGLVTYLRNLSTGDDRVLDITTLSEKCGWDKTSSFMICGASDFPDTVWDGLPDDWYQGTTHFKDSLFLIGVAYKNESRIFNLSDEAGESFDLVNPSFDSSSAYFSFMNKNTNMLWMLHVNNLFSSTQ